MIPCRDEAEFIEPLLAALVHQDLSPSELIFVDNGSTDDTVARVASYARTSTVPLVTRREPRIGAASALNTGIAVASGDVIVRLDGHSIPEPDYIERCVRLLDEPGAGVVGGVWKIVPQAATVRAHAIAVAVSSRLGSGGADYRDATGRQGIRDVDTVPFGCFRRSVWEQLGGYDESLQVVEDGDFNFRVRQAGYRVILDPAIRCTYFPRRRFRTLGRQYLRYGWWKVLLFRKHPGAVRVRQMIPLAFVTVVVLLAFVSIFSTVAQTALLLLLGVYAAALVAGAVIASSHARALKLWPAVAAAYAVIHFAWGLGGLTSILTFGRWPPWRAAAPDPQKP